MFKPAEFLNLLLEIRQELQVIRKLLEEQPGNPTIMIGTNVWGPDDIAGVDGEWNPEDVITFGGACEDDE